MHWPQFLLVEGPRSFVWGGTREIYRIESSKRGPLLEGPEWPQLTQGLDGLAAASRTPTGMLVVCDTAGAVRGLSPGSTLPWSIETHLRSRPGGVAVTDRSVYLLLQGDPEAEAAVVAYDFSGGEVGRWGKQPLSALIQARMNGGGIAACPDGSVFYSYVNSPEIFRLEADRAEVRMMGRAGAFQRLSDRSIRRARRESERSRSVAPLVKLGLSATRVMSLLCSREGLLFRQVARPAGGGSYIEIWNAPAAELLGTVPATGVLLDVRGQTLYLGAAPDGRFHLQRTELRLPTQASWSG